MFKSFKTVAAVALVAVASYSSAKAASVVTNGSTVDGWTITTGPGVVLVNDGYGQLTLEKFATFGAPGVKGEANYLKGALINFTQACPNASKTISIATETITNKSGVTWTGFQNILASENTAVAPATFAADFDSDDVSPFTSASTNAAHNVITYSGGKLPSGTTGIWGDNSVSDIVINANPTKADNQVFSLKELPLTAIPLPAAAWSGLSGLIGLGLMAHAKKLKKVLA